MTNTYTRFMYYIGKVFLCMAVCAGILACVASCMDDELFPGAGIGADGRIAFRVREGSGPVTKAVAGNENDSSAVAAPASIPLYIGGDTLWMTFTAGPNRGITASGKPFTRGIPFDTLNNKVREFTVAAYREDTSSYFKEQITIDEGTGLGLTQHHWPAGNLSFFAYACTNGFSFEADPAFHKTDAGWSGTFSYGLPQPGPDEGETAAEKQPDIVFAISPDKQRTTGPVDLLFHHALSAIVFKVGKMPEGVTLQSITIGKVYSSGTCTMTSDKNGGIDNVLFSWKLQGDPDGSYTQQLGNQPATEGEKFNMKEHMFLMLPQEMKDGGAQLQLKFSIGEKDYTWTHAFYGIGIGDEKWKPDTKYTFTIGLPEEIDVEVTDNVEGIIKKDVQIQNTGISTGYIRAAIVGYWVANDGTGNIVAPWKEEEGDLEKDPDWDTYWTKGDDGFYYYNDTVAHNQYARPPLFNTYTLKEDAVKQHAGQKLELSIVAQIVIYGQLKEAWPDCPISEK